MDIGINLSIVGPRPKPTSVDPDTSVSNFELESGGDLLLESGDFLLLE